MPKTAWPTEAEVTAFAEANGITVPSGLDLGDIIDQIVEQIEMGTGFRPFLEGASADFYYDPPSHGPGRGYTLMFRGGMTAVTAVTLGITNDYAGYALTENQEFFLRPIQAPTNYRPFTFIDFQSRPIGQPRSIKVTGTPGFSARIPLDLWQAALGAMAEQVRIAGQGGYTDVERIKQGPVEYEFAGDADSGPMARLDQVISRYRNEVI